MAKSSLQKSLFRLNMGYGEIEAFLEMSSFFPSGLTWNHTFLVFVYPFLNYRVTHNDCEKV